MNDEQDKYSIDNNQNNRLILEKMTYIVGILTPIITLPQMHQVLFDRKTAGLSMISWVFYLIGASLFATYGIVNKVRLMQITYIPSAIVYAFIVLGLILY
jgi:uncharacterized protein with PQ loop repeat